MGSRRRALRHGGHSGFRELFTNRDHNASGEFFRSVHRRLRGEATVRAPHGNQTHVQTYDQQGHPTPLGFDVTVIC